MQAATLPTKKAVNKGKIKKTLKNVLCRPDPIFWPVVSDSQKTTLETALNKYKVEIPVFKKLHWRDLKNIPKDKRPKPPKIKRIEGLFFGISECSNAISNKNCAAVILEASVKPQAIVQPIIEACVNSKLPVVCMDGLRSSSMSNFGIPTISLGIKCDCLTDLRDNVAEISNGFELPQVTQPVKTEEMEINNQFNVEKTISECQPVPTDCPYLYRTSKNSRMFNPSDGNMQKNVAGFSYQNFIEFLEKDKVLNAVKEVDKKCYKKMVLKKISNNPKRAKRNE